MAARKLAAEVDRTLKKVTEGVELFEGIFDKINMSTNQAQKEKLESDLKSQIKKLQRLRDQIKTWMQSNDIKDKQPLIDNRKLIETQMERFKACEKEMKTKAFSKEGLSAAAKLDPKEQQKLELCNWIGTMVDELSRQVEQTEAEIESLQLLKKKKDSDRSQRLDELETLNERRTWHVGRLELILRLLENGNLQCESVENVKEDIAYFVESNTEEEFEEDEGIYDDLNLEEEEEAFATGADDHHSTHDDGSVADDVAAPSSIASPPAPPIPSPAVPVPTPRTPAKEVSIPTKSSAAAIDAAEKSPTTTKTPAAAPPAAAAAPKPSVSSTSAPAPSTPARKATLEPSAPRPAVSTPVRAVSGPGPAPTPTSVPPLPPIRYAAAAAAANAASATPSSAAAAVAPSSVPPASVASPTPAPAAAPSSMASSALPPPPGFGAAAASRQPSIASAVSSPELAKANPPAEQSSLPATNGTSNGASSSSGPSSVTSQPVVGSPVSSSQALPETPAADEASTEVTLGQGGPRVGERGLPSSLSDLVTSFESAKQKSMKRDNDLESIHGILDAGFSNVPQPLDAEKPKYYVPRNPFNTPAYYPHEPSGQFANPALFSKFDVDTLFYIFYYCQGTYLQYLAAAELKKQSWRFHKQYLTWFQRANEPQQITEEYEQGVYIYWDWEGSWCQRRKSDFRFEYRYLSPD